MGALADSLGANAARRREDRVMWHLARIATGDLTILPTLDDRSLRQLGYAASLVHGHLDDPHDYLGTAIRLAADELAGKTVTATGFRDPVQARWGAPRHLDVDKLRLETPLHLLALRRRSGSSR